VTVIAAIATDKMFPLIRHQGPVNANVFLGFLKVLNLQKDDVLLMDNVPFHKSPIVKRFYQEVGVKLLFIPPYSPWFNPIELCFSIIKRHHYQYHNIDGAFKSLTSAQISSFYRKSMHCTEPF
jgi:transposase